MSEQLPAGIEKVQATGIRSVLAFVDYADGTGELKEIEEPTYPQPVVWVRELRQQRRDALVTLKEAADRCGLTPEIWSGIEQGRYGVVSAEVKAAMLAAVGQDSEVKK